MIAGCRVVRKVVIADNHTASRIASGDIEVVFGPSPDLPKAIVKAVDGANWTLDIAIYSLDHSDVNLHRFDLELLFLFAFDAHVWLTLRCRLLKLFQRSWS